MRNQEGTQTYQLRQPGALPTIRTSFIGREQDLQRVRAHLVAEGIRHLTLTGTSGVGKTRLAVECAHRLQDDFPGGISYVDLSTVRNPGRIVQAIMRSTGTPPQSNDPLADLAHRYCGEAKQLLVIDNFEQVLEGGPIVQEILDRCPSLSVIVTSQSLLRVSGEHGVEVEPLDCGAYASSQEDQAEMTGAARLFVDRAMAVHNQFAPDNTSVALIVDICNKLDGIPLAIELAASRSNILSPAEILTQLNERVLDLSSGLADQDPRHRRLRSAISSSYGLLRDSERMVLRRLSVLQGSFTLQAAAYVANLESDSDLFNIVSSLVDRSLINRAPTTQGQGRFTLFYAVREFGLEQLESSGELSATRTRHLEWFVRLAEEAEIGLIGSDHVRWSERITADYPNIGAAIDLALQRQDAESSIRLASAMWEYWSIHGELAEGKSVFERALELDEDVSDDIRGKGWHRLGNVRLDLSDYAAALDAYQTGLRYVEDGTDSAALARSLNGLGRVTTRWETTTLPSSITSGAWTSK